MKRNPQPILFLALLIWSVNNGCQGHLNGTKDKQFDTIRPVKKVKTEKYGKNLNDTSIVNQELSFDALAFEVFKADTNKIKYLFLDAVKLKMEKQNDPQGAYHLYNFSDGINKLILYYNDGFYMQDGDIRNNRVRLNKKISIGMTRGAFLKVLKTPAISCDTITVADEELSFESVYIFKNARLSEIKMGQTVE